MYNGVSYDKNESYAIGNSYTRTSARTNFDWTPTTNQGVAFWKHLGRSKPTRPRRMVRGHWHGHVDCPSLHGALRGGFHL